MPFKLGFEFQENSRLCKWALENKKIQKLPLFEVKSKEGKILWHVEIDTEDIEFVTESFSLNEEDDLLLCIQSICTALTQLKELILEKDSNFWEWFCRTKEVLQTYEVVVSNKKSIELTEIKIGKAPLNWSPMFSPQVTIQHPLEYTIGLYSVLLFSPKEKYPTSNEIAIISSLPFLEKIPNGTIEENDPLGELYLRNKGVGLIFLNALTMLCLTPTREQDDIELLKEALISLERSNQFDAKMKLPLMSRRPFSTMFQDIDRINSLDRIFIKLPQNYCSAFGKAIENTDFTDIFEVSKLFYKVNYAEQYFQDLSSHVSEFNDEFIWENLPKNIIETTTTKEIVEHLLRRGIISTTMIRNLKTIPSDLEAYFNENYYQIFGLYRKPKLSNTFFFRERLCPTKG